MTYYFISDVHGHHEVVYAICGGFGFYEQSEWIVPGAFN